jgi:hypothetical protein
MQGENYVRYYVINTTTFKSDDTALVEEHHKCKVNTILNTTLLTPGLIV